MVDFLTFQFVFLAIMAINIQELNSPGFLHKVVTNFLSSQHICVLDPFQNFIHEIREKNFVFLLFRRLMDMMIFGQIIIIKSYIKSEHTFRQLGSCSRAFSRINEKKK